MNIKKSGVKDNNDLKDTDSAHPKNWDKVANRKLSPEDKATDDDKKDKPKQGKNTAEKHPPAAIEHPSYKEMEDRLTKAEQLANLHHDNLLRNRAEFDNFQRRMEKQLANAHKFGIEKLALDLIPVLDGLDHGLENNALQEIHTEAILQIKTGMDLTYKMLLNILAKYSIEQIDPKGQVFDPTFHEAMSTQEDKGTKPGIVLNVLQKGYRLHERLVRPARVIVSS